MVEAVLNPNSHSTFAQNAVSLTTIEYTNLLDILSNSSYGIHTNLSNASLPQTTAKQLSSQQSIAQSKPPPYDSKGAAYYICSVIVVYALAIVLLVVSLTKRKRKDQYQPANQRSTTEDYYVNIQRDWSLESSGTRFFGIDKYKIQELFHKCYYYFFINFIQNTK